VGQVDLRAGARGLREVEREERVAVEVAAPARVVDDRLVRGPVTEAGQAFADQQRGLGLAAHLGVQVDLDDRVRRGGEHQREPQREVALRVRGQEQVPHGVEAVHREVVAPGEGGQHVERRVHVGRWSRLGGGGLHEHPDRGGLADREGRGELERRVVVGHAGGPRRRIRQGARTAWSKRFDQEFD
jgi:hypothetical protein